MPTCNNSADPRFTSRLNCKCYVSTCDGCPPLDTWAAVVAAHVCPPPPSLAEMREAFADLAQMGRDALARVDDMLAAARAEAVAPLEARVAELERDMTLMTASRDLHRDGLITASRDIAELTAALRALVEAMPRCHLAACGRPGLWEDGDEPWCDEHAPGHAVARDCADALAAALALLAKEPTP